MVIIDTDKSGLLKVIGCQLFVRVIYQDHVSASKNALHWWRCETKFLEYKPSFWVWIALCNGLRWYALGGLKLRHCDGTNNGIRVGVFVTHDEDR